MLSIPASATTPIAPEQRAENTQYYHRVLHRMIDLGANLAERIQQTPVNPAEATAAGREPDAAPTDTVSREFDRVTRGVRRSIILAQRIQDPVAARAEADPAQHRILARKRILRVVEDEIHDKFDGETAEAMRQELLERLDSPELEDDIDTRPIDEIIIDIRRDLDTAGTPGFRHAWKRRTPDDVANLHGVAATTPSGTRPARPPAPRLVRKRPILPANDAEAVAMLLRGEPPPED